MKRILYLGLSLMLIVGSIYSISLAQEAVPTPEVKDVDLTTQESEIGINLSKECLRGVGKNCFEYEKLTGIDGKQKTKYTVTSIAKDVIYAATYTVGTVLTVVIIYCGLGYIFASRGGKDTSAYKKGLINAVIGAILVRGAYTIVRLIQYIAKG